MAVTVTFSNHYKYQLLSKTIDWANDTFKALLVRQDALTFNADEHDKLEFTAATTAATTLNTVSGTKKITRAAGSFVTEGYRPGIKVVLANTSAADGTYTTVTVSALEIVVSETIADSTGSGDETLVAQVEVAAGSGYARAVIKNTPGVGEVNIDIAEDDALNAGTVTFGTISYTASGGAIGPCRGVLLYDDTVADDTVVCYIDLGENVTITDGNMLSIQNLILKVA